MAKSKFIPKPDNLAKSRMSSIVISERQAKRVASGKGWESDPNFHNDKITDEDRARTIARHAIEDRRMFKEMEWN